MCRRCGSDLSLPQRICEEAEKHYLQSMYHFQQGEYQEARLLVKQALHLKREPVYELWQQFIVAEDD